VTDKGTLEIEALMRNVKAALEKSANLGKQISPEVIVIANNMDEPGRLADLTASNLELKVEGAQEILERSSPSTACARSTSSWPRSWKSWPCSRRSRRRPRARWTARSASSSCASS
jgi:ATP-dependent Lon protease